MPTDARLAVAALLFSVLAASPSRAVDAPELERTYGIKLLSHDLQAAVAPEVERPGRPVRLTDLPPSAEAAALRSLQAALSVYPPGFVGRLVHRIAMAGTIEEFGHPVGGFFHADLVAIAYPNVQDPASAAFDTDTFHHEFSSLVRAQVAFNVTTWTACNPPGFHYMDLEAYKQELSHAGPVEGDEALHQAGFVSAYGRTGLDNDFNTYAERVFGHPEDFARAIAAHPRMRAKTRQLISIYEAQDDGFTAFFDRTGLRAAATDPD